MKTLPVRTEVNEKETWNLADLFKTEEDYEQAIANLEQEVGRFAEQFEGQIDNPTIINEALGKYRGIMENSYPQPPMPAWLLVWIRPTIMLSCGKADSGHLQLS